MFSELEMRVTSPKVRHNSDPGHYEDSMMDLSSNPSFPNGNNSPHEDGRQDISNTCDATSNISPQEIMVHDSIEPVDVESNNSPRDGFRGGGQRSPHRCLEDKGS